MGVLAGLSPTTVRGNLLLALSAFLLVYAAGRLILNQPPLPW
jgi:hypothetical protein